MQKTYSTEQAAEKAGIHRVTLARWLSAGHGPKPSIQVPMTGRTLHRWTESDVQALVKFAEEHKDEGRTGRPPKKK